ncbi:MAG: E3 ubiquitin protein ligase, partial [Candidatus Babeliales bacterium]|nr:E3 ubiquitin protein ligase [Candidatus Babeliales bacterium]
MKLSNLFLYITLFTYSSSLPSMAASSSSQTSTLRKKCSICLSKKMVKNFATLSCTHSYCNGCLNGLIDTSLTDKSTTILRCPNRDCKEPIGEADIRSITKNNSEKLDAYADVSTNEWIDRHPHAKRCPTPDCSYAFINDRHKTNTIQCPSCTQSYCSGCLIAHEKNIP